MQFCAKICYDNIKEKGRGFVLNVLSGKIKYSNESISKLYYFIIL